MYVCPSARVEQLDPQWAAVLSEIGYLSIFRKFIEKIQVPLQSDNNNRYFT
jgi:hypothetical protein